MFPVIHIILPSYATLAFLGMVAAVIYLCFNLNDEFSLKLFLKTFILCFVFGFLGARFVFFLTQIPSIIHNFSFTTIATNVFSGGLVYYGGLFGVLITIWKICKSHNLNTKILFNKIIPAIPLFHSFGRVGCFMAGCCYGCELSSATSIFGLITIDRFPTQLVESLFNVVIFICLLIIRKHTNYNLLKLYLILYSSFRFFIEFTRGDKLRGVWGIISTSQIISLGIIGFIIISYISKRIRTQRG